MYKIPVRKINEGCKFCSLPERLFDKLQILITIIFQQ